MERNRAADQATLHAVHAAAQRGAHTEAALLAQAALADGLEHPLLLNVLALSHEQRGEPEEAARLLTRAVQIAPQDQPARNALGLCLLRLERPGRALVQFEALLQLNPSLPFAHVSRGTALAALGLIAEAEQSYQQALALDPQHAVALAGLASLASSRGAYTDARSLAQSSLALLPGLPEAVLALAAAELGDQDVYGAEARIRALLADPRIGPLEHARANGLLGDILDAKNYTSEAFAAYSACNQELQKVFAGRFTGDQEAYAYVCSIQHYFEQVVAETWKQRPARDPRHTGAAQHVFLLGFPRSGSTLIEVILKGHRNIVTLQENESLIDALDEFMRRPADLDGLIRAPETTLERLRAAYWHRVAAAGVDVMGKMFVDENPLNILKLPLIARLFPDARILFACRDPRDVVLSCFRHRFRMSASMYQLLTLAGAAGYYERVMQLGVQLFSLLPLETYLVRHEDVVQGFAREMQRICAFLQIEWDPAMGDFALRTQKGAGLAPSATEMAKELNTEGIGQWRRYERQLAAVRPVLEPWVKRFCYEE
ncbi:MAG TPA: sulfotransferase [Steroidobacteraceae bacterium]|nr:sulfotransferase [Steroidobacteraceae bacterium]